MDFLTLLSQLLQVWVPCKQGPRQTLRSLRGFDPSAPTRRDGQKSAEDPRSFACARGAKQVQNAKKL